MPSFLPNNNTGFEQDREGQDKKNNFNNTMLADKVVVPPNIEHVDKETSNPSIIRKTTNQSFRTNPPSCNKSNPYISGMDGFRRYLFEKGVSVKGANLIFNSRTQSSLSGCESSWKKWSGWCDRRAVNPFRFTLVSMLDYLTSLFEEGLEYNTIAVHRSAISAYHGNVDDMAVGQHPLVTFLMAGIFNSRPPQPRYIFVWDVQVVLNFIKKDWDISSSLTDQELTYKLCMLLSLTTASRVSGWQHFDIRYMTKGDKKVTFYFAKLHKSWHKGKPPPSLTITGFPEDPQLCVIETLDTYLDRTKHRRLGKCQLLLSFQKPYKEVVSSTISGWIKKVLKLAKIDTDIYKAHSTRSASTSNVKLKGLPLGDILK